jgi:N-acetylglucosamine-6-phosphate deacetylase
MLRTVLDADCLVLPDRLLTPGKVSIDKRGRISEVLRSADLDLETTNPHRFLAPGLVDLQVNGFGGIDLLDTDRAGFDTMGKALLGRGVTGYLPTLISSPAAQLLERLETISPWCEETTDTATPLGIHLEGPFLSPDARGTHRSVDLRPPDPVLLEEFLQAGAGKIRIVTLAPELPGAMELIETLSDKGILISLGHSRATYDCAIQATELGATLITHFGNAMVPIHQREPGLPGAGLADPRLSLGLIPDLVHLHAGVLRMAWQAKGRNGLILVSDAMTAAGLADGQYAFGGRHIHVEDGVCRDEEGHLAGASLDLFEGLNRFLDATEISPCAGFQVAAANPARHLGLSGERGSLQAGARADLLQMVRTPAGRLVLDGVYLAGRPVHQS